jgi:hypothetical protein
MYCFNNFNDWWNVDKFNWNECHILPQKCEKYFDTWWPTGKYHSNKLGYIASCSTIPLSKWWNKLKHSKELMNSSSLFLSRDKNEFDLWWDPQAFNWTAYSGELIKLYNHRFDDWWDPNKFNWFNHSTFLLQYAGDKFDKWWDPKRFNWRASDILADMYASVFDKWWNPDMFRWDVGSSNLAKSCSVHIKKWWNPSLFNWDSRKYLVQKCSEDINIWFVTNRFVGWRYYSTLFPEHCSKSFDTWWYPNSFDYRYVDKLKTYAQDFKDKWEHEYLIWKLAHEGR